VRYFRCPCDPVEAMKRAGNDAELFWHARSDQSPGVFDVLNHERIQIPDCNECGRSSSIG
jgi:hypothetical protein